MKKLFCLLLAAAALSACHRASLAQERADHLARSQGDVVIAVAWPLNSSKGTLVQGIELAVDEVNRTRGVLGGRKLRIVLKNDESSLTTGRLVAQEIADDIDIAAVIGHLNTYVATPAEQIYDRAGLVMVTPGASGQAITAQGSRMVFRTLPGNRQQGRQIAEYAAAQGYRNVGIYYIKNDYGIDLANNFEEHARKLGITVADRRSYNKEADDHAGLMNDWATFLKLDAIFLIGSLPESPNILRDIRAAGIKVPVFGGAGLDSPDLIKSGGGSVEGTVVFTLFNPDDARPAVVSFCDRFRQRYGAFPDSTAAQGYDAVKLLTRAIDTAHSIVPADIATALHGARRWEGVTGYFTFGPEGEPEAKPLAKSVVKGGRFVHSNMAAAAD